MFDFFSPSALGRALDRVAFSVDDEVDMYVNMIRNSTSDWVKIAAARELRSKTKEALVLSGAFREVTGSQEVVGEDGAKTTVTAKTMSLFTDAADRAGQMLSSRDEMVKTEIIDVEFSEVSDGEGTPLGEQPAPVETADSEGSGKGFEHDKDDGHYPPTNPTAGGLSARAW